MKPETILFPTDFSGRCDRPRQRAIQLARQWGAKLIIMHVMRGAGPSIPEAEIQDDRERTEARLRAEVQDKAIVVATEVRTGDVASAIVQTAADYQADLIVTGVSRREAIGDFIIGTTVETLVRQAAVPVLVVKSPTEQDYRRIMVATDFSDCSATALRWAASAFRESEITLLHAYTVGMESLRGREGPAARRQVEIAEELDHFLGRAALPKGFQKLIDVNVDYGDVCDVARDHVQSAEAELAIVGTHGRAGVVAAVMGSTARSLVACLECDVLLVRSTGV